MHEHPYISTGTHRLALVGLSCDPCQSNIIRSSIKSSNRWDATNPLLIRLQPCRPFDLDQGSGPRLPLLRSAYPLREPDRPMAGLQPGYTSISGAWVLDLNKWVGSVLLKRLFCASGSSSANEEVLLLVKWSTTLLSASEFPTAPPHRLSLTVRRGLFLWSHRNTW